MHAFDVRAQSMDTFMSVLWFICQRGRKVTLQSQLKPERESFEGRKILDPNKVRVMNTPQESMPHARARQISFGPSTSAVRVFGIPNMWYVVSCVHVHTIPCPKQRELELLLDTEIKIVD